MYFHEFIYKSYSALLILLFFFVRDEQKNGSCFVSHFPFYTEHLEQNYSAIFG